MAAPNEFEYGSAPVIAHLIHTSGNAGQSNSITGSGLLEARVSVCGDNAVAIARSVNYIDLLMPLCSPGELVDVTITNLFGSTTFTDAFQYEY